MSTARQTVYQIANFTMVKTDWQIGKMIVEKQGGEEQSEYGKGLIKGLSKQMIKDCGKSLSQQNLAAVKKFYNIFLIVQTLSEKLNEFHYQSLLKVENVHAREFYINECIRENWSTRQLDR